VAENGVILSSIFLELNRFGVSTLCVSFEDLNFVSHGIQVVQSAHLTVLEGDDVSLSFPEPLQGLLKFVVSLFVVVNSRVSSNFSVEVGKSLSLLFRDVVLGAISLGSTLVVVLNGSDFPALFGRHFVYGEVEALEASVGIFVRVRTIDIYLLISADKLIFQVFVNRSNISIAAEVLLTVPARVSREVALETVTVRMREMS